MKKSKENVVLQELDTIYFDGFGALTYVRLYRLDGKRMTWDDICGELNFRYPHQWSFQLFPPEKEVVNEANVYHLWLFPIKFNMPMDVNIKMRLNLRDEDEG